MREITRCESSPAIERSGLRLPPKIEGIAVLRRIVFLIDLLDLGGRPINKVE
jgi:hypothetical protein